MSSKKEKASKPKYSLYVVCGNEFVDSAWVSKTEAEAYIAKKSPVDKMSGVKIHWRISKLRVKGLRRVFKAFQEATDHLEYCGYGDSWERECAEEAGLGKKIDEALAIIKEMEQ